MSGKQEGPTQRPGLEPGKVEMAKKGLFWVWGGSDVSTISPHLRKPTPAPGLGIEHPNIGPLMYHHKLKPARGEWEFPFPVIPGKTSLKFPFPSRGILFFSLPVPGKRIFWPGIKTGNTIIICSFVDGWSRHESKSNLEFNLAFYVIPGISRDSSNFPFPSRFIL